MAEKTNRAHLLRAERGEVRETACGIIGWADSSMKSEMLNFIGDRRYEISSDPAQVDCRRCLSAAPATPQGGRHGR